MLRISTARNFMLYREGTVLTLRARGVLCLLKLITLEDAFEAMGAVGAKIAAYGHYLLSFT
jgi:hypothetical protein